MSRNSVDMRNDLRKKLTKRSGGEEGVAAILAGITLFILISVAMAVDGWLLIGMGWLIFLQTLGIVMKIAGWRSVTLRNDEQEFLARNYNL